MSYTPPAYTDAGGSVVTGYAPPSFGDVSGDVFIVTPSSLTVGGVVVLTRFILLADLFFNGGHNRARVSTDWWYSKSTDSIGIQEWQGRIVSEPTFGVRVGCRSWGSKTSVSIGSLEVADPLGELDWTAYSYRDMLCEFRLAQEGESYDTADLVCRAIIDSVERQGTSIVVQLRGYDTLLDKPFQSTVFTLASPSEYSYVLDSNGSIINTLPEIPVTDNFTTSGTLVGARVPAVIGRVYQHEPALSDPQVLGFQVADAGVVSLDAVMSGGSVANPPTMVTDPDWDYIWAKSGFQMHVTPSARITVNCDGIAALSTANVLEDFRSDAVWSGDVPTAWTVFSGSGLGLSRAPYIGAHLQSAVTMAIDTGVAANTWVVVLVDVPDLRQGYLTVTLDRVHTVRRAGKHSFIAAVTDTSILSIESFEENGACEISIASVFVYPQTTTTASSLTQMARHMIVARGGIADSEGTWLPSTLVGSNSLDLLSSWNVAIVGVASAQTDSDGRIFLESGDGTSSFHAAQLFTNFYLTAGVQYRLTMTVNATVMGAGTYIVARTTSTDILGTTVTGVQTLSTVFISATTSQLNVIAGVFYTTGSVAAEIYDITLEEIEFAVDGAGVDFESLALIDDGYQYGLVCDGSETVREALSNLTDSISAWFYPDNNGKIMFGQLADASGEPVITLSDVNMLSPPNYFPDLAPGLSDTLGGARNWSPYGESELAGITYPDRPPFKADYRARRVGVYSSRLASPYTHAIGAESIGTLLYDGDDVQSEVDRLTGLYTVPRGFWEVEVALESALAAVALRPDLPAYLDSDFFCSDNGTTRVIVGVEGKYGSNVVKLIIWGGSGA